jgi:hypothetical protein
MSPERPYVIWPTPSNNLGIRPQYSCDCQSGLQGTPKAARHCTVLYRVDHSQTYVVFCLLERVVVATREMH